MRFLTCRLQCCRWVYRILAR